MPAGHIFALSVTSPHTVDSTTYNIEEYCSLPAKRPVTQALRKLAFRHPNSSLDSTVTNSSTSMFSSVEQFGLASKPKTSRINLATKSVPPKRKAEDYIPTEHPKKPKISTAQNNKRKAEEAADDFQLRLDMQQRRWQSQPWRLLHYCRVTVGTGGLGFEGRRNQLYRYSLPLKQELNIKYFDFVSLPLDIAAIIAMSMSLVDMSSLLQTCSSLHDQFKHILNRRKRSTLHLIEAVKASNKDSVIRSLQAGADPEVYQRGSPLLHMALECCTDGVSADIVQLLLESGCNPNSIDMYGRPAIYCLNPFNPRGHHIEYRNMVCLLEAGADPNHGRSGDNCSLLFDWLQCDSELPFLSLLLKSGCNPNTLCPMGYSILCHAVDDEATAHVKTLLKAGADPNVFTSDDLACKLAAARKSTPLLHRALQLSRGTHSPQPSQDIVLLLLQAECDPNVVNPAGYTALYEAIVGGYMEDVEFLLKYADPNIATPRLRWTPLHFATYMGNKSLVKLLCDHGANPNKRDATDSTALHMAVRYRLHTIRSLLCAVGADPNVDDFLGLKPGSYRFKKNIDSFNSVVGPDIDIFGQKLLLLSEDAMTYSRDATQLVCGGGLTKQRCCNGIAGDYTNRVFEVDGVTNTSRMCTIHPSVDGGFRCISDDELRTAEALSSM